jgi:hypothetical protein
VSLPIFLPNGWASKAPKNKEKSAARFCLQVAPRVPDMFCNFYLGKNHKITNDSATSEVSEIISTNLKSIDF